MLAAHGPARCAAGCPALAHQQPPAAALASRRALLHTAAAGAALLLGAGSAQASSTATGAEQLAAAARGCVAAVSAIPVGGRTGVTPEVQLGSGIVWDGLGHVVTAYAPLTRVLRGSPSGEAQIFVALTAADGSRQQLPATLVARDPPHELIVLQVTPPAGGLRPVTAGSSSGLRVGQDALLLGALPGGDASLSAGVVSATGRTIPASNNQAIAGVLQTDAEVNSQSLGGALLDSGGRLIGMPVVSYVKPGVGRSSGVNFCLSADMLLDVVPRLIVYGSAAARR